MHYEPNANAPGEGPVPYAEDRTPEWSAGAPARLKQSRGTSMILLRSHAHSHSVHSDPDRFEPLLVLSERQTGTGPVYVTAADVPLLRAMLDRLEALYAEGLREP